MHSFQTYRRLARQLSGHKRQHNQQNRHTEEHHDFTFFKGICDGFRMMIQGSFLESWQRNLSSAAAESDDCRDEDPLLPAPTDLDFALSA
jgi:hypothetical protein